MAVVVPLLSMVAAGSAAAGVVATGVATFGTFLTIAGGVASGIGLLTKDKDLQKIGGILSLASGVVNGVQNMAGAGTQTAAGADAASTAEMLTQGAQGTESLLTNPGMATGAAQPSLMQAAQQAAGPTTSLTGMDTMTGIDAGGNVVAPMGGGMGSPSAGIAQQLTGGATSGGLAAPTVSGAAQPSLLEQAARNLTQSDVASATRNLSLQTGASPSLWETVKGGAQGIGQFMQKNPVLSNMGFQALAGMYGPEAEAMDYQRSLYERSRRNLNNPIRLQFTPGG